MIQQLVSLKGIFKSRKQPDHRFRVESCNFRRLRRHEYSIRKYSKNFMKTEEIVEPFQLVSFPVDLSTHCVAMALKLKPLRGIGRCQEKS